MNKPLDPMSVERVAKTETPSAAYVLRRRYGRARPVITIASWVTVINLLFQPVVVLAASYSSTQTGNYNANTTWGVAANPGGGTVSDTVSVNGTHTVTVTLANDASTDTVTVNAGGTLSPAIVTDALKGGTIVLNGGNLTATFGYVNYNITYGGAIQVSDNSTITVTDNYTGQNGNAWFGALTFTGADKTLQVNSGNTQTPAAQFTSLTMGANNGTINVSAGANAGTSALIGNSGTTLTKTGSQTLRLNGAATWTGAGGVIANAGTVEYNFADSLGTTTGNQINNTAIGTANVANAIRGATVQVNAGGTLSPAIVADALNGATIVLNGGNLTATFG